jgi:centromere protein C
MPTSARKSSLGAARRAQQRAHLPFHADNLGLGKRTGLPVPTIDHKSDDFEPFDEILSHADARAGWQGQNKRPGSNKKRKSVVPLYEEDDGGEMSMELDDYSELRVPIQACLDDVQEFHLKHPQGGPVNTSANVYFSHTRQPSSPLANRAGSSSRRVARASDVDFDAVPSPRPRRSLISNLRRSSIAHPLRSSHAPLDTSDDVHFDDGGGGGGLYDEHAEMESPEPRSRLSRQHETPRRATLLGSEDESSPNTRSKGKRRAMQVNDEGGDNQVEDEIAQGLDDAEMQQEDEDEEVAEPPPKKKKAAEKRPRKRELPVVPCRGSFAMTRRLG